MFEDDRFYEVRSMLHRYMKSPSLRHLRPLGSPAHEGGERSLDQLHPATAGRGASLFRLERRGRVTNLVPNKIVCHGFIAATHHRGSG
jgi:hypothetical protein